MNRTKCLMFDVLGTAPLSIVAETIQSITIGVIVSNTGYSKLAPTNRAKLVCHFQCHCDISTLEEIPLKSTSSRC